MWNIYAASGTFLLIAEADRVLCHPMMFLPVFLHWIYKMKLTAAIDILLLFLAGLFIRLYLRNASLHKKKSEIIVSRNKLLLLSSLHAAGLCESLNYLMGFRAASRQVSLSNYIAFDVFFFSGFMFVPSFYAHL